MDLIAVEPVRVAMPDGPRDLEPGERLSLPDRVGNRLLELAPGRVRVVASDLPDATENSQTAFSLNAGMCRDAPMVRSTLYEPGQIVEIHSPMLGPFQAEVLRDNGVIIWIWHPFIEREAAIPNEWLIGEGKAR